jgi:hypothetical protein
VSRWPGQGLRITTNSPDVEIVVDGRSYGRHRELVVPLSPGMHRVEGRKERCFTDYEQEVVEPGSVDGVSLLAKRVRVQLSPRVGVVFCKGEAAGPALSLDLGLKNTKHYWGAVLMFTGDGPLKGAESNSFHAFGLNHSFISVGKRNAIVDIGTVGGYYWFKVRKIQYVHNPYGYGQYEDVTVRKHHSLFAGPRLSLQVGGDHAKLLLAGTYMVRLDSKLVLWDKRNPLALQAGLAMQF